MFPKTNNILNSDGLILVKSFEVIVALIAEEASKGTKRQIGDEIRLSALIAV